jgi:TolB-like protein/Tfp pilus assembly protein PilF
MSPERDQEHFCDGIAEELISSLARIRELRVAARTSAFFFKGKTADIREIGQKLGVEAIVEGSVRKAGSALRITVQLINVADGYHLWTERYDREIKDVFAIQDEVTSAIIEHLMITLLPEERSGIFRRKTDSVEAHELYLKGLHYLWMDLSRGFKDTIQAFEQAIEKDPEYAHAYWGLSDAYLQMATWGKVPPSDACRKAKFYVRKALAIDPSLGEAHALLSYIYVVHDWDWKTAELEFLEAIRLNPNSSIVHAYYCYFLLTAQRFDEAMAEALKAQSLDPASSFIAFVVGTAFGISGDFPRAIEEYQTGIRLNPDYYMLHTWLGWTLFANGQYSEGIVAHEKALELSQRLPYFVASLATAYHKLGRTAEADALWRELEERAQREYVPAICFVQKHS